jgi:peroxiredoxin
MSQRPPAVDVGDRAPDFTLRHTFEESVSLRERLTRGPVVLAFYVFDFGGV